MKMCLKATGLFDVALFLGTLGAPWLSAQVTNDIKAHIDHSFVIGDKTLPPGDYTFRTELTSGQLMIVRNSKGDNVAQFSVRESIDNRTLKHSELVFKKHGDTEFLSKIYEGGNPNGVAVSEISREESRLMKEGRQAMEHTEEQQ